jgi:DNA-binding NtrC family response regulator
MNILLIEDDKMTMKAVKFALNQKGHKVVLASNETNALNQLREHKDIECIVSDINLPGEPIITDMIRNLRNVHSKPVPIILISSVLDNPLIDDSLIQGAEAFIPKPIDHELLLNVISRLKPHGKVKA